MGYGDGEVGYRTSGIAPRTAYSAPEVAQDAANYDTLKAVYTDLKREMTNLDKWHAFSLDEKTTGMTIKQQILAHQIAFDMVEPILQTLESALLLVDKEFIERQNG